MALPYQTVEFSTFIKGLITEASPLNAPADSSLDEVNFVLNRDGSRDRRLGIDFEDGYALIGNEYAPPTKTYALFKWENVGEDPSLELAVVQMGNVLRFHELQDGAISSSEYSNSLLIETDSTTKMSFSSVDGFLVAVNGSEEVFIIKMEGGVASYTTKRLLVRDLFGLTSYGTTEETDTGIYLRKTSFYGSFSGKSMTFDDPLKDYFTAFSGMSPGDLVVITGTRLNDGTYTYSSHTPSQLTVMETFRYERSDSYGWVNVTVSGYPEGTVNYEEELTTGNGINIRPTNLSDTHLYNLRNQSWGMPRAPDHKPPSLDDPIGMFKSSIGKFPSNADTVWMGVMADSDESDPIEAFFPSKVTATSSGGGAAPKGFFIIDALRRGNSRKEESGRLLARNKELIYSVGDLPEDYTPGGPKTTTQYAGRVWYAGFSGEVVDGDKRSPRLGSYVMFSQLVDSEDKIVQCYQEGDPTSEEASDVVATDGGFIKVSGAYDIRRFVQIGTVLLVLAANGVWAISGGNDYGFAADNYQVSKVSDHGVMSPESVVVVDNSCLMWGKDGIYVLGYDDLGKVSATSLTDQTIQSFYEAIPPEDKLSCFGAYDKSFKKVSWVYNQKELVYDVVLGAFSRVVYPTGTSKPAPVALISTPPYRLGTSVEDIVVAGEVVLSSGEPVVASSSVRESGFRSIKYLTMVGGNRYTFSSINDQNFLDWASHDGGVDAAAYLVTSALTAADTQRDKWVPYLTVHCRQTEESLDESFELTRKSSCKVQSQWEWSNSATSNRWGGEFEAYRLLRHYIPPTSDYDNGLSVVSTKNKLRGSGKALSIKFSTSPGKDCRILGWAIAIGGQAYV